MIVGERNAQGVTASEIKSMSLDEAEALHADLIDRMIQIDAQFTARAHERASRDANERSEYWRWRDTAASAKLHMTREAMLVKARVKELRHAQSSASNNSGRGERIDALYASAFDEFGKNPDDEHSVLVLLYEWLQRESDNGGWELSSHEKMLLRAAQKLAEVK